VAEEKMESLFHEAGPSAYAWGLDCLGTGGGDNNALASTPLPTLIQEMQRESANAMQEKVRMLQEQLQASEVRVCGLLFFHLHIPTLLHLCGSMPRHVRCSLLSLEVRKQ
jgi:hypothetical protein